MNYPRVIKIIEAKKENSDVKTFLFEYPEKTIPGLVSGIKQLLQYFIYNHQISYLLFVLKTIIKKVTKESSQ